MEAVYTCWGTQSRHYVSRTARLGAAGSSAGAPRSERARAHSTYIDSMPRLPAWLLQPRHRLPLRALSVLQASRERALSEPAWAARGAIMEQMEGASPLEAG